MRNTFIEHAREVASRHSEADLASMVRADKSLRLARCACGLALFIFLIVGAICAAYTPARPNTDLNGYASTLLTFCALGIALNFAALILAHDTPSPYSFGKLIVALRIKRHAARNAQREAFGLPPVF